VWSIPAENITMIFKHALRVNAKYRATLGWCSLASRQLIGFPDSVEIRPSLGLFSGKS
jgi:hypothetical protein